MHGFLARKLKYHFKNSGLTVAELAAAIDKTPADILDYQSGRQQPDIETYKKISHVLDVSTDELLVYEDDE